MLISDPAATALASLSATQLSFLKSLPKAELHAHLNGSIPLDCLRQLANENPDLDPVHRQGLAAFENVVHLNQVADFFCLFPAIYALTSTPKASSIVTRAVLHQFLVPDKDGFSDCTYLELRTTPRQTAHMTRLQYLDSVLSEIELFPPDRAALVISIDRRMSEHEANECVDIALRLKSEGRRVVGLDLCGDPHKGDVAMLVPILKRGKEGGLGITVHIAETPTNGDIETFKLLSAPPSRLGHATFLSAEARDLVARLKIPIEICLTSNILCKTVSKLDDHHIKDWLLRKDHPIAICTDDILPFRTSLLAEYALIMAAVPIGLGLDEDQVRFIAESSMSSRFGQRIAE